MKASIILALAAAAQAINVKPMSIDGQASVDFNDETRQAHTDKSVSLLNSKVFQGDWNDLKRYHETVVSQRSWNEKDKDY